MTSDRKTAGLRPPWKKGRSGNPKGAKKGVRHWNVVLREQFEKGRIRQAKAGNLRAFELLAERLDGKAGTNADLALYFNQNKSCDFQPVSSASHIAEMVQPPETPLLKHTPYIRPYCYSLF